MFEALAHYLRENAGLTADEIASVRAVSLEKKLAIRQPLLRAGEVCHYNCFIVKGCLRLYRIGEDGAEHILRFGVENWWISDRESYRTGLPSQGTIEALEASEVILLDKPDFNRLIASIPALRPFTERLLAKSFDANQNRIMHHISGDAKAKYQHFIITFPHLANRVPLHMIASYLGVSRETLSRLRHQFAQH